MIIGIDGNEANVVEKVGVHQGAFEILWGLYKLEDNPKRTNRYIIFLKNAPNSDLPGENEFWKYKIIRGGRMWVLTRLLPELLKQKSCDVFFSPTHYLPPFTLMPKVCLIADLGYLKFSEQFKKYDYWQLRLWTAISVWVSKYIIANSYFTARDIVRHYNFAKNKVRVAQFAGNEKLLVLSRDKKIVRQCLQKYRIQKKYLVFVSTLKPSKNIEGLIDAFSIIKRSFDYQLVVVGKKGWMYESIFSKVRSLRLVQDVVFTDYVPESDKAILIQECKLMVLPSFWEGFGIDVLNAFAYGRPIVVSRVASLPEVAGEAGIYVDPGNPRSIANGIEKVLKMSREEYNRQVEKGYRQLEKFSWKKTAKKVQNVLEQAVHA